MSDPRSRADRVAGALAPWVGMYGAGVALHAIGIDALVVEMALVSISGLLVIALVRPRARLVSGKVALAGAAIGVAPLALLGSPLAPLVPGAFARAWWWPLALVSAAAAAIGVEELARRLARAPAGSRARRATAALPLVVVAASAAWLAAARGEAPQGHEALAAVEPIAILRPEDRELRLGRSTFVLRCDRRECDVHLGRGGESAEGARPLPRGPLAIAALDGAWLVAPAGHGAPSWHAGIAFSGTTLEPVAIVARDLPGRLAIGPRLVRAVIAAQAIALLAIAAAELLRRRGRAIAAMREVVVGDRGEIAIDGAIALTEPRLEAGAALIDPRATVMPSYRDEPPAIPARPGARADLLARLGERTLALELLALAAALTGLAPLLGACGHLVPRPW